MSVHESVSRGQGLLLFAGTPSRRTSFVLSEPRVWRAQGHVAGVLFSVHGTEFSDHKAADAALI